MFTRRQLTAPIIILLVILGSCRVHKTDYSSHADYCVSQAKKATAILHEPGTMPRSVGHGERLWKMSGSNDWTCGFWPGIEWYLFEYTRDSIWKNKADQSQKMIPGVLEKKGNDHDLGFMMYCSYGNGYRLTGNPVYKDALLRAADTLASLYNPKAGTMLSWPRKVPGTDWPLRHNTIMDNMMNLELLFWASKNGGSKSLYDIAVSHAMTTMKNQFRPDNTSYHVVLYDTATGKKVKGITHQGYSDNSMWARGQAWAIYGYTMVYRETKNKVFLDFSEKVADVYLKKLPRDLIPYWDFNDPAIPDAPRDASAACITASALLELSSFVSNKVKSGRYRKMAIAMLRELSAHYQSRNVNDAFLLHSTGNRPAGTEIDASIIYADYYYLEGLIRAIRLTRR